VVQNHRLRCSHVETADDVLGQSLLGVFDLFYPYSTKYSGSFIACHRALNKCSLHSLTMKQCQSKTKGTGEECRFILPGLLRQEYQFVSK